jgi:hypothetical protein
MYYSYITIARESARDRETMYYSYITSARDWEGSPTKKLTGNEGREWGR